MLDGDAQGVHLTPELKLDVAPQGEASGRQVLLLELTPERLLKLKEAGAPAVELEGRAQGSESTATRFASLIPIPKAENTAAARGTTT